MANDDDAPTGRLAGAIDRDGLTNSFLRGDRKNGLCGYWTTQELPFGDKISFRGYLDIETAVYKSLEREERHEPTQPSQMKHCGGRTKARMND